MPFKEHESFYLLSSVPVSYLKGTLHTATFLTRLGDTDFSPSLLMSEHRGDAPSSFIVHLFSAQVNFLNVILFPSFQLLPSNIRNPCPPVFLALCISFSQVEKNLSMD